MKLNKEVDSLRKQTTMMREKIVEQNCLIKNMCKTFSKKLQDEQHQQQHSQLNTSNNTTTTTTTTSSVRLSSSSINNNESSSGFFNLNSSQVCHLYFLNSKQIVFNLNLLSEGILIIRLEKSA